MKNLLTFISLILLSGYCIMAFGNCEDNIIKSVSDGGGIIVLLDGSVWEVSSIDKIDSMLWLPSEDVIICNEDSIINKDENGEKIDVKKLN